ncbi:MAG: Ig-like domain-containing protein [Patescibacteria group bacterium]
MRAFRQKPVFALLLGVVLIAIGAVITSYYYASGEITYYVSPTGNDSNPGTLQAPFKTVTKASAILRGTAPAGGATVYLRGGKYDISQTINLNQADSGASGNPIVYQAYENETPVFDGTIDLPKPLPATLTEVSSLQFGKVFKVDMSTVPGVDFRSSGISNLLWNGKLQKLGRFPNYQPPNFSATDPWAGQFFYSTSDTPNVKNQLRYSSAVNPANWSGAGSGLRAVVFSGPNYWDSTVNISSINTTNRLLNFSDNTSYNIVPNNRFYVENSLTFLDQQGEWFYDKTANKLFVYLATAPASTDIFSVVRAGDIFNLSDVSNVGFDGLVVKGSTGRAFHIRATNASSGVFVKNSEISATNFEGVRAGGKVTNMVIDGNNIHDVGWDGVYLNQDVSYFKSLTSGNNQITNNLITRAGNKWRAKTGIEIYSVGTRVANNEIHDLPRMGLFFRGNDNVIEFNKIYNINQETQDSGGIYMFGRSWLTRGNLVRGNYLYKIGGYGPKSGQWQYPFYTFGIYFDDFSSGNSAINNVVVDSGQAGLIIHGGRDMKIENNFLINSKLEDSLAMIGVNNLSSHLPNMWAELSQMEQNGYDKAKYFARYPDLAKIKQTMTNEELYASNRVTKNIFYHVGSIAHNSINSRQFLEGIGNVSDNNVFWSDKTYNILNSYKNLTYTFAQWQALGKDVNSVFADPKFASVSGGNFSFTSTLAIGLGIQPINVLLTGPVRLLETTPIINISMPVNNDSISGTAVFSASVADTTALESVMFKVDGTTVATFKPALAYSKNIDTTRYADGLHKFSVVAVNANGNLGSATVDFSIGNKQDSVKPTIRLTYPTNGSNVSRTIKLTAEVSDNIKVIKVEFYLDGVLLGADTSGPYTANWNTRRADNGQHQIYAKAYDAAGNTATTAVISVTR